MNIKEGVIHMVWNDIATMIRAIVDISLIWILAYAVLKNLKGMIQRLE